MQLSACWCFKKQTHRAPPRRKFFRGEMKYAVATLMLPLVGAAPSHPLPATLQLATLSPARDTPLWENVSVAVINLKSASTL